MQSKTIFILLTVFALASFVSFTAGQTKNADERALTNQLPKLLNENEVQSIIKQTEPKSHVEATLKVSDARVVSAMKNVEAGQYQTAVEDVDVYASLIFYANDYTRKLPDAQSKDRSNCLKKIEQAIFKQTRTIDTLMREFPHEYHQRAEAKIDQVKQIRLQAINDLIGGGQVLKSTDE